MTARVLDRRSAAAHRLRIERARMTAELWQLVRLGPGSTAPGPDALAARQSARRAKSLLGVVVDSAASLGRATGVPKSKRPSRIKAQAQSQSEPQPKAQLVPAARESISAARLESTDGRVVRAEPHRAALADVMEIATGLAGILKG